MAFYTIAPNVARQLLDDNGDVVINGKLYTKVAGLSTDSPTYQTSSGTLHSNPILLDDFGRITGSQEIFLAPGVIQDWTLTATVNGVDDVVVWTKLGIAAVPASTVNVDVLGTAGEDLAAEDVVYLSAGDGGKNAGQWYKADADLTYASSDAVTVGMVPSAITQGNQGTIRLEGDVTVTGPLTPGANYFASAVAGALTGTEPTNSRFIGQSQTTTSIIITPNRGGAGSSGAGFDYLALSVFGT